MIYPLTHISLPGWEKTGSMHTQKLQILSVSAKVSPSFSFSLFSPDDLNARTVTVCPDTASSASFQQLPGPGLGVSREGFRLQQWRMSDQRHHLADEGDRLVSHRMSITNIGLDHCAKWLLDSLSHESFQPKNQSSKNIFTALSSFSNSLALSRSGPLTA